MLNTYLKVFDRKKIINRLINKFFLFIIFMKKYIKNDDYIGISNIIECEAHRELLITGLKAKIKELEKKMKYNFLIIKKILKMFSFKKIENHYIMSYYKVDTRNLIFRILTKIKVHL